MGQREKEWRRGIAALSSSKLRGHSKILLCVSRGGGGGLQGGRQFRVDAGLTNGDCLVEVVKRATAECLFFPSAQTATMNIYLISSLQTFWRNTPLQPRQLHTDDPLWHTMNAHDAYAQLVTLAGSNVKLCHMWQRLSCPLMQCKRRFERECKEADRAQQYFEKMDADINVTKADVEKVLFIFTSTSPTRAGQSTHGPHTPTQHLPTPSTSLLQFAKHLFSIIVKQPIY